MAISEQTKKVLANTHKRLWDININEVPKITKVIVAIGIGSLATRKGVKDFSEVEKNLKMIAGQKPHIIHSKKSVSNFKLREGMPVMMKVTLRGQKAYDFLFKVMSIVLPRVRDFEGLSTKSFDGAWNYNFGLPTYNMFPELHPDDITIPVGLQMSIWTKANSSKDAQVLLEELGFVFKK